MLKSYIILVCFLFLDVDVNKPDEKSIMTYIAQYSRRYPDLVCMA